MPSVLDVTLLERIVSLRRELHQRPELSGQEAGTARVVARVLDELDGFTPERRRVFFLTVLGLLRGSLDAATVHDALGGRPLATDADVARYEAWLTARTPPGSG